MSIQYLAGAEIDYKEDIEGAQFVIRNPNASTTCGCGSSVLACKPSRCPSLCVWRAKFPTSLRPSI